MNRKIRFSVTFLFICSLALLPAFRSPASFAQENAAPQSALRDGKVLLRRGKSNEAIIKLDLALKGFTANNSNRGQAATHDALGELYERGGQYDTARTHYEQAHEAFTRATTDAKTSEAAAAEVIGLEDASGNEYNANLMLAKIGNMYVQARKTSEARQAFDRMKVVKPEEIKPEQSVQRAKEQQQKAKRGKGLFGRVASAASSAANSVRNDPLSSADSARGAARSTAADIKATASTVTGTIKLYRELIVYATHEIGLGRVAYFDDNLDQAKTHFENALNAAGGSTLNIVGRLGQSSRFRTAARTALGDIAYRQNRFDDAVKIYREAAASAQADKRLELIWSAERGLGRSLRAQAATQANATQATKLRLDALASYRASLATIERLRAGSLQADEARTVFLATTSDVFTEAAALLGEMALLESKAKGGAAKDSTVLEGQAREYAAEGLRIVEQGRARSLLDLLNEGGAELTVGVPAELVTARRTNLDRQQELAAEATGIALETSAQTPRAPAEIEAEVASLETEYVKLENAIRTASPRYAALTAPQPLALERIQQGVLDEGTALIEYSLGEEKSYLWAITREQVAVFALPSRASIETQVVELRNTIVPESLRREITQLTAKQNAPANTAAPKAVEPAGFARASAALYKTILEPAASIVGKRRLLIVADGALNYIPFAALVTNSSAAADADYSQLAYLIKTNEVIVAPSASVISLVNREKPTVARKMLIVADPVFAANDPRAPKSGSAAQQIAPALESAVQDVAAPSRSAGSVSLVRLNGSRTEATQIAQLARTANLQADILLDLDASEANVEARSAQDYRIVHVATHGLLNSERPQFTGLVLSLVGNQTPRNATGNDGFLRTEEIFNLRTNARLVMLSACETGLGKERRGEGVIGLTRAFMYAGAPTVGVSLWSVSDRSTAMLMTKFYERVLGKDNVPPVAALRAAQIGMIANPRYSAPFFWAPFILVGDWR